MIAITAIISSFITFFLLYLIALRSTRNQTQFTKRLAMLYVPIERARHE
jgi:hypothetical protein